MARLKPARTAMILRVGPENRKAWYAVVDIVGDVVRVGAVIRIRETVARDGNLMVRSNTPTVSVRVTNTVGGIFADLLHGEQPREGGGE